MLTTPRLAAAAAVLALTALPASALVIDNFEDGEFALTVVGDSSAPNEQVTVSGNAGNIIGGTRRARLDLRRGRGVVDARTLGAAAGVGPAGGSGGVLAVSDSGRAFSDFVLSYENLGGVDLTEGGTQNAFALDFDFFQGFSRVEAVVDTGAGTGRRPVFVAQSDNDQTVGAATRDNAQVKVLSFADFSGTADFSDVDRITFFFQSSDTNLGGATDFELESITTIPEPAGLVLFAAGAGLLASRRRRA